MDISEHVTELLGSRIAPYDSVVIGLTVLVPTDDCLPLVSYADPFNVFGTEVGDLLFRPGDHIGDGRLNISDDFERIMLKQALGGCILFMFDDILGDEFAIAVKEAKFGRGGRLVK